MAILAIKGHPTRGKDIIEILEMLGGKNDRNYECSITNYAYRINEQGIIDWCIPHTDSHLVIFTLEEFLEKFPYKVGDKVTLDKYPCVIIGMNWDCDDIIYYVKGMDFSKGVYSTDKDLQPYKEETMEIPEELMPKIDFNEYCKDKYILDLGNYEIKEENGKTYAVRKRLEYPKTYEECCDVLKIEYPYFKIEEDGISASTYKNSLFGALKQLLICRDAYWKMTGEQMGLGKSWEPDFTNNDEERYGIYTLANKVEKDFCGVGDVNTILVFPTEEMRDAFYENFKDLIEQCKDLL